MKLGIGVGIEDRRSDEELEKVSRETQWVYEFVESCRNQLDAGTHPCLILPQVINARDLVARQKKTSLVMFNNYMKLHHQLKAVVRMFEDAHNDIISSGNFVPWHLNKDLDVCRNMYNDYGARMNISGLDYEIEDICVRELEKLIQELQ